MSRFTSSRRWDFSSWPVAFCIFSLKRSSLRSFSRAASSFKFFSRISLGVTVSLPGEDFGSDRQLVFGQGQRLKRDLWRHPFHLVNDAARLDHCHPLLRVAFAFSHSGFEGFLGDRL